MKRLFLTIKREFFTDILLGVKKEEYRTFNERYARILGREYDLVLLQNGYSRKSPRLYCQFLGVEVKEIFFPITQQWETVFAIKLGKIVRTENVFDLNYDTQQQSARTLRRFCAKQPNAYQRGTG